LSWLWLTCLLICLLLRGLVSGPLLPSVGADDSTVGTLVWSTTGNIFADDANYATVAITTSAKENSVKLVTGGTIGGNEKSTGASIPTVEAYVSYGGSADTWGLTITAAQVNSTANFGAVFSCKGNISSVTHYLKATGFGFNIAAGSTVLGVLVEWKQVFVSGTATKINCVRITVTYAPPAGGLFRQTRMCGIDVGGPFFSNPIS
jgi:hypothetical protein